MLIKLIHYSYRALSRQRTYVVLNILGLSIGMACSFIIALFIMNELSYDNYHDKKDQIYRLILNGKIGGQELKVTSTASPIGPTMKNEFPEVADFLRLNGRGKIVVRHEDRFFTEDDFIEADSSFFNFFSIGLLRGEKDKVLNAPHTVVLSETTAKKIFGESDPIDQMLRIGNDTIKYRVTGVMNDVPEKTHFKASMIGSFMTNRRSSQSQWLSNSFSTYLLLHPQSDANAFDVRIKDMIVKYVGPELLQYMGVTMDEFYAQGNKYTLLMQPMKDIHLDPSVMQDFKPANDPKYLWIFGSVGILILLIAAINFMNLSTAQAGKRAKEVGIKKVVGSSRGFLISQFLVETIMLAFVSLILALAVTQMALPYFDELLDTKLYIGFFERWYIIPGLLFITVFIGFLAGSYPAFYLSSFNPYEVLKGKLRSSTASIKLRSVLVVLQFTISIVLIIATIIMFRQINYMLNKDLGFNKEHVVVLNNASAIGGKMQAFKEDVKSLTGVISIASSTAVPGHNNNNNGYRIKGREEGFLLQTNWVDFDYFETYGFQLADGRFFDKSFSTDKDACLINERAARDFLLTEPLEARFVEGDPSTDEVYEMPIIGLVKDFHYESLRNDIMPYIFRFKNEDIRWGYISIRLSPQASSDIVSRIETVWASYTGNEPMQHFFMEKDFERMYKEEKQNGQLSILFTILGIMIASLGLYGLTSFTVISRTKEIGVRKTFGASITDIWYLISKEIIILLTISTVLAWPLVYWVADIWLRNYHYRIDLRLTDFIAGFVIALAIALLTTSYRTILAASSNPSISLRYE
ncbi:MAG: ABC transporter permease [Bacteroidetes bacterium]|nr:ABC transporter permease [Bacteroidota bacterium]